MVQLIITEKRRSRNSVVCLVNVGSRLVSVGQIVCLAERMAGGDLTWRT